MPFNDAAQREWEEWQNLCKVLLETCAVTKEDLEKSVGAPEVTNGQRVLNAIRKWGSYVEDLAVENHANDKIDEIEKSRPNDDYKKGAIDALIALRDNTELP